MTTLHATPQMHMDETVIEDGALLDECILALDSNEAAMQNRRAKIAIKKRFEELMGKQVGRFRVGPFVITTKTTFRDAKETKKGESFSLRVKSVE